jgi:hypothetical protein
LSKPPNSVAKAEHAVDLVFVLRREQRALESIVDQPRYLRARPNLSSVEQVIRRTDQNKLDALFWSAQDWKIGQ